RLRTRAPPFGNSAAACAGAFAANGCFRYRQRLISVQDAAAVATGRVAADGAVGYRQYRAGTVVKAPAIIVANKAGRVADDAVAECQASFVEDATPSVASSVKPGGCGQA